MLGPTVSCNNTMQRYPCMVLLHDIVGPKSRHSVHLLVCDPELLDLKEGSGVERSIRHAMWQNNGLTLQGLEGHPHEEPLLVPQPGDPTQGLLLQPPSGTTRCLCLAGTSKPSQQLYTKSRADPL